MTTKNISKHFEGLRAHHKSYSPFHRSSDRYGGDSSLLSTPHSDEDGGTSLDDLQLTTLPPKWVDLVGEIQDDFLKIEAKAKELQQAYDKRLKVSFGNDEEDRDMLIDEITHQVTLLIRSSEKKIRAIAFCDTDVELTKNESNIRLNVMRNLGSRLHELSKTQRQRQQDYMSKLKSQQQVGNDVFAELQNTTSSFSRDSTGGDIELQFEQALEQGLNDEQLAALQELEERADEREKAIIHLAQSVNEISGLVQELNMLVIQQGTILDRIDYNVEQSLHNVIAARQELEKSEEYSKKNWMLKIMIGLFIIIIIETIILVIKYRRRK